MDILKVIRDVYKLLERLDFEYTECGKNLKQAIEYIEKQEPVAVLAPSVMRLDGGYYYDVCDAGSKFSKREGAFPVFTYPTSPKLRELSDEEYSNIFRTIVATTEGESITKAYGKACIAAAQEGK